mmetsp:Transcript_75568/g.161958  ORF Transcript_75568/g.161958 Transcript_75568/m.161958 type:complete len:213 (+) Transcript_75568:603-1241(+)
MSLSKAKAVAMAMLSRSSSSTSALSLCECGALTGMVLPRESEGKESPSAGLSCRHFAAVLIAERPELVLLLLLASGKVLACTTEADSRRAPGGMGAFPAPIPDPLVALESPGMGLSGRQSAAVLITERPELVFLLPLASSKMLACASGADSPRPPGDVGAFLSPAPASLVTSLPTKRDPAICCARTPTWPIKFWTSSSSSWTRFWERSSSPR